MVNALDVAAQFRRELLRREREAAIRMVRLYGEAHARILSALEKLTDKIAQAELEGLPVSPAWLWQEERYQRFLRTIEGEMQKFAQELPGVVGPGTYAAVDVGVRESRELTDAMLARYPAEIRAELMASFGTLHTDAVVQAMGFLAPGSPAWTVLDDFPLAMRAQVEDLVMEAMVKGWNPRRWARELRLVTGRGLDWALNWSRTLQLYSYREASRWSYINNQQIVRGWMWYAALDSRCCMGCVAMHGTEHPLSEPLNDHHRGRCAPLPMVIGYEELGLPAGEPFEMESGEAWFARQPEELQMEMMGPGKFKAWQDGLIKIADMVEDYSDAVWGIMRHERSLKSLLGEL